MKCLIILLAVIAISAAVTTEERNALKALAKACRAESGVESEILRKALGGNLVDDPKFKAFFYCLYKKVKFYREDGTIDAARVRSRLPEDITEEQRNAIMDECLSLKGTDKHDTAFLHYKCYRDKSGKTEVDLLTE